MFLQDKKSSKTLFQRKYYSNGRDQSKLEKMMIKCYFLQRRMGLYRGNKVSTKPVQDNTIVQTGYRLQTAKSLLIHTQQLSFTNGTIKTLRDAPVPIHSFKEERTEAQRTSVTYPKSRSRDGIQTYVFSHYFFPGKNTANKSWGTK